jgi:tRNA (cmo5U34)-methyltransferase
MKAAYSKQAATEEIKTRFDQDVERFSNLDTGQFTTIDAPLTMELCREAQSILIPEQQNCLM